MVSSAIFSINIPVRTYAAEKNITNEANLNIKQVKEDVYNLFANSNHTALNTNCYKTIDMARLEVNALPESQEKLDLVNLMYQVFDIYLEQNNIKSVRKRVEELFANKEQNILKSNVTKAEISSILKLMDSFKLPKNSSVAKERLYELQRASRALDQKQIIVDIPDTNFAAILNRRLGKNKMDYITKAELATITDLDINDTRVKDWHGIEYTNLKSLRLDATKLTYADEDNTWGVLRPASYHKTSQVKNIFIKNCSQEFFNSARWNKAWYPYLEKLNISGGSIYNIYGINNIIDDVRIENQKLTGTLSHLPWDESSYEGEGIAFISGKNRKLPDLKISDGGKLNSPYWINWTKKQLIQSKKDYVSCSWDDGTFSGEMIFNIPKSVKE